MDYEECGVACRKGQQEIVERIYTVGGIGKADSPSGSGTYRPHKKIRGAFDWIYTLPTAFAVLPFPDAYAILTARFCEPLRSWVSVSRLTLDPYDRHSKAHVMCRPGSQSVGLSSWPAQNC